MKVSMMSLGQWLKLPVDAEEMAKKLTMAGLEVDSLTPVAGDFRGVIVAEVLETSAHPEADKLTICRVHNGQETLQIVCGAKNVHSGMKVALATVGAVLPGDFNIKPAKLRGVESFGMLCSASELGMDDDSSEGIIDLPKDAPVGANLRDYLKLNDTLLEIDLTPNRADCFSVKGIARELSALLNEPLQHVALPNVPVSSDAKIMLSVKDEAACPSYFGRVIRNIRSGQTSPFWLKEFLRRHGASSIHPVVDATNYIMLMFGQPMHGFDADTLHGNIVVRQAIAGEELHLLNGDTIRLHGKELLITDEKKPLALAGVMGGDESAIGEESCNVFLESAYFTPERLAGVARLHGLCTDSSQRFERGVDPELQLEALERATALILDLVGGEAGPVVQAVSPAYQPKPQIIEFNPELTLTLTGMPLKRDTMAKHLMGLGFEVDRKNDALWHVRAPSHRVDIAIPADLVEEIIRIEGYNTIPRAELVGGSVHGTVEPVLAQTRTMLDFMLSRGYHETISYSFLEPALAALLYPKTEALALLNPISSDLSVMRQGMWCGLLASLLNNQHRQQLHMKAIEQGHIFRNTPQGFEELPALAGLLCGAIDKLSWISEKRAYDFFDAKGDLEALARHLGVSLDFQADTHAALHPGKTARLYHDGKAIGWLGVVHPAIADALDLQGEVVLFELLFAKALSPVIKQYQALSKYPMIRRDLSFLVDADVSAARIESVVRSAANPAWFRDFQVFDVYQGTQVGAGQKSVAISFVLQNKERTLTEQDITHEMHAIIKALEEQIAISLRDAS